MKEIKNSTFNTEEYLTQIEGVLEIARIITSTFATDEIMENIVKKAVDLIDGADTGALFLYDQKSGLLVPEYGWGFAWDSLQNIRLRPNEALSGRAFIKKKAMLFKTQQDIKSAMESLGHNNQPFYKNIFPFFNQNFRSSMCAPLIWKEKCLGVLAIHNVCSSNTFIATNLRLVEHVATHAAVALANARMYDQQRINVSKLERTVDVHEKLTHMVLSGEGLQSIAFELAGLLSNPVYIFDNWLECMAKGYPSAMSEEEGENIELTAKDIKAIRKYRRPILLKREYGKEMIAVTVSAGETILGYLAVYTGENHYGQEQQTTIEQVAMVIALEMMKKKVSYETEKRMKVDLIQEILQGTITKETYQKLSLFGYDPTQSYTCMVCTFQPSSNESVLNQEGDDMIQTFCGLKSGIVTFPRSEHMVILYPMGSVQEKEGDQFKEIYKATRQFVDRLEESFPLNIQIGVGRSIHHLDDLAVSFREAEQTLSLLRKYGGSERIWTYRSLGPLRFLLQVADEDVLQTYLQEVLGPLLKNNSESGLKLLETLITWIGFDRQIKKTAEALFIHHNTLSYRLQKIEEMLDVNLRNEEDWLTVQLAVRLWETLRPKDGQTIKYHK
jgi:sugar diacid utilization regulator